jgi:4-diphosphocytidyl-2-C-methyl-D-erythritol kinase
MATNPLDECDVVRCWAPAKINLYLHVLGNRPDGYHDIDTLIVFASVSDQVSVAYSHLLGLRLAGPFAHDLETTNWADNLVVAAVRALAEACDISPRVTISLHKNLPVAAGLGGGSSDAAATLRALARLWGLDPLDVRLHAVAESLGADVPACLLQYPVVVGGRGEIISQAPALPAAWLVLVNPCIPLATADVFRQFSEPGSQSAPLGKAPAGLDAMVAALMARSNDLEQPAMRIVPQISEIIETISKSDGCLLARMSGSGATCFGIYAAEATAVTAAAQISNGHDSWWVSTAQMLTSSVTQ